MTSMSRVEPASPSTPPPTDEVEGQLAELRFLQRMIELATTARTWDELMRIVVDRATRAMDSQVCSLYLLDRDGHGLTLAATNGVDRQHIGIARLRVGQGLTGIAADTRAPVVSSDMREDPRCAWIRGVDHERFTSLLAVPLLWNEQVVGVINIKTEEPRDFSAADVRRLSTIANLLAGIVERGRLQVEAEAQLDSLRAIDQARAELNAVVTHQLRTPLAVVRAYLDLLSDAARSHDTTPERIDEWHRAAVEQLAQLDSLVGSVLGSLRGDGTVTVDVERFEVTGLVDELLTRLAPMLRRHVLERYGLEQRWALGDAARFRQVLELLLENAAKYAPEAGRIVVADWIEDGEVHVCVADDGLGVPVAERESVFEPFVRLHGAQRPGSGIGLFAARRLMQAMGGHVWIEDRPTGGSQFVAALPLAPEP
jgi:signal transduction histidine kinase